jgi:hypothetical protein
MCFILPSFLGPFSFCLILKPARVDVNTVICIVLSRLISFELRTMTVSTYALNLFSTPLTLTPPGLIKIYSAFTGNGKGGFVVAA